MLSEKVLDLQPDFIIAQNGDNYEALSKIAPTIVYEYGKLNTIEQLRLFGDPISLSRQQAWRLYSIMYWKLAIIPVGE
ncbi:hypothetical protein [Paenibacillus paridis]|uniref:hypothetical protein n=1 Tax=Paenibacillus paridis TaxID=2583376 RepID=UPI001121085E|nr:hypothetical protein [Paenibacillus paridis]